MAAAAKLGGNCVDVHLLALGPETDARKLGLDFFEYAGAHHRRNGADMIDKAFRVARLGSRPREVGLLEPEIGNLILVGQAEVALDMAQQTRAGEGIRLVNFITDLCQVSPAPHQFACHMIGARTRGGVLE